MHPWVEAAVALGHLRQPHAVSQRVLASLAVVTGLAKVKVPLGRDEANEALVPDHVSALRVGVDQAVLCPFSKALVLAF